MAAGEIASAPSKLGKITELSAADGDLA